jgi:response regulator of citrate/malate metabolism
MVTKDDVLIVEDSPVTGELLKSYLEQLDYFQIHICATGKSAVETFKSLVRKKIEPIVLLDYSLPDITAHSVFTQMLKIKPNVHVILETATEREDPGIKDLIRLGAFRYLEKPILFESLKEIFETIEKEQDFSQRESTQIEMLKQAANEIQAQIQDHIEFVLKSLKQLSVNFMVQLIGQADEFVISHLKKLEDENKIINLGEKKEIACNQCDSVKITQLFYCPACKSSNFKLGQLIEHYDCGNITEESSYKNDMCPNCHREIKALGVDYRVMQNHYICNNCSEFFPEISSEYFCLKCEVKFRLDDCSWKSSTCYKAINM